MVTLMDNVNELTILTQLQIEIKGESSEKQYNYLLEKLFISFIIQLIRRTNFCVSNSRFFALSSMLPKKSPQSSFKIRRILYATWTHKSYVWSNN